MSSKNKVKHEWELRSTSLEKKEDNKSSLTPWGRFWSHLQLKKTKVDQEQGFHFDLYNWKTDGMIFLSTALFVPFVFLFIFRFALGMGVDGGSWVQLVYLLISLISAIVGFVVFFQRDRELFIKSGLFIFYLSVLIPNFVAFIVIMIASLAGMENGSAVLPFLSLWSQIVAEIIVIVLALVYVSGLHKRIIKTLKENWWIVLIVGVIGVGLFYAIVGPLYEVIFKNTPLSLNNSSINQNNLLEGLDEEHNLTYRIFYALSLFILTIMVAPFAEELATRNAWFTGVGNQTLGLITTALYFGMLHTQSGDVEHMLNYFLAGFILGSIFLIGRGNVTYDWLVHAGYNTITLIVVLVQNF